MLRRTASLIVVLTAIACGTVPDSVSDGDGGPGGDDGGGNGNPDGAPGGGDVDAAPALPSRPENHLRLCEYSPPEWAFSKLFTGAGAAWKCVATGVPCTLDANNVPTDATYSVQPLTGSLVDMNLPDGSQVVKLSGGVSCQNIGGVHSLKGAGVRGQSTGTSVGTGQEYLLGYVDGGEAGDKAVHVKGTVTIALGPQMPARTNDLRLTVQSQAGAGAWVDAGTQTYSVLATAATFELNADVPAGAKIRLRVAGMHSANDAVGSYVYLLSVAGTTVTPVTD